MNEIRESINAYATSHQREDLEKGVAALLEKGFLDRVLRRIPDSNFYIPVIHNALVSALNGYGSENQLCALLGSIDLWWTTLTGRVAPPDRVQEFVRWCLCENCSTITKARDEALKKTAKEEPNKKSEMSASTCAVRYGSIPSRKPIRVSVKIKTKSSNKADKGVESSVSKDVVSRSPLKKYKVSVKQTIYGDVIVDAFNEIDAELIASGKKRMYDGSMAFQHFSPNAKDAYMEICDMGSETVVEIK